MSAQTEVATKINSSKKSSFKFWMIILAALSVLGVVCWFIQLNKGLQMTNLSVTNMWGLYITFFMIFTGVAAGCLFFASLPYLFSNLEGFKPFCKIATYVGAVSSIVAASLFIIVDIGNPERAWLFITSGNFSSPMFWDFLMLAAYMIISVIFTRQLILVNDGKKDEKSVKSIAIIGFIAGIMVIVTSFVFTFQISRPMWHTPGQSVSFLLAAFVAALAVLTLVGFILNKSGYIQMPMNLMAKMGKAAAALLSIELILVVLEVLVGLYPGEGGEYSAFMWMISGGGAAIFWSETIALVVAIVLLGKLGKSSKGLVAGAVFALVAIFLIKTNLLQSQLFNPLLTLPGPKMYGNNVGPYIPSLLEIGLSVGIIALGALLLGIGLKVLNLGAQTTKKTEVQKAR
jgi:Ni/Fe-hydrogenase subunit HybB-like protein